MDNRVFNVNGEGDEMLLDALRLAFKQEHSFGCDGWAFNSSKGLILLWSAEGRGNKFPATLTPEQCLPFVIQWLKSDQAKTVKLSGWFARCDHDGSDEIGWRVYCEDWGHVGDFTYSICAITPAVLWLGK